MLNRNDDSTLYKTIPSLAAYIQRIGATALSLRKFVIKDEDADERYPRILVEIRLSPDNKISVKAPWGSELSKDDLEPFSPTDAEREAIKKDLDKSSWPKSILAQNINGLKGLVDKKSTLFPVYVDKKQIAFVQERRDLDGKKAYMPWSFFSDGKWRMLEPDGLLPLYGRHNINPLRLRIMIHEGPKSAQAVSDILKDPKSKHPWKERLDNFNHYGWLGGAHRPQDTDWSLVEKAPAEAEIILVADNDWPGINAVAKISKMLQGRRLKVLRFDERFPDKFDLADPWPLHDLGNDKKSWWNGERYIGPSFDDCLFSCTWATKVLYVDKQGRPKVTIRNEFADEWISVSLPPRFVERSHSHRLFDDNAFNTHVRPFSDVTDTARAFRENYGMTCTALMYNPSEKSGLVNIGGERFFNTYRPPLIKPVEGDPRPFFDFMDHLIVEEKDRHELLRWCATLIARPEIKMLYSVLLMSETHGVGKGTLGEKVLAPIIGEWNASFPSEQDIVESAFNGWLASKRLIVIHEIYAGKSSKAYNKLKSHITDSRVHVNKKYEHPYDLDNWAHLFACSNSLKALKLASTDRRWFVPKVVEEKKAPEWWRRFNDWLTKEDGLGIIKWWADEFLKTNAPVLPGDEPPASAAKDEMISDSLSDGMRFALDVGATVMTWKDLDGSALKRVVAVEDIRDQIGHKQHSRQYLESSTTIRNMLKQAGMKAPPWKDKDGRELRYWKAGRRTHIMLTWDADPKAPPLDWETEYKKEKPEWQWADLQNMKWGW
jgi:Family of unknown function (DUF5906)